MTTLRRSIIAAGCAVVVTAGALFTLHAQRAHTAAELRAANAKLVAELNRRRAAPAPSGALVPAPVARTVARPPEAPAPAARAPEDYRNEGRATPMATLQTFAWACDRGDAATVAQMLFFDGGGREKAKAYLASLPEPVRAQWPTVEAMAATLLVGANMNQPFPAAKILDTAVLEKLGEDRAALHLPDTNKRATTFQKTRDGWAYAIPEKMVDDYLARSAARSAPNQQP